MLKRFILLLLLLISCNSFSDTIALPDIGASSENLLTPKQEQRLGKMFMRQIRRSTKLINDPEINQYIKNMGVRLTSVSEPVHHGFHFFVVDNPMINAFAGPAGHIGVHTGLILATQSESELASVISHEIAHITQRHLFRAFEQAQKMSLPATAALLATLLLGANSGSGDLAMAGIATIQAATLQQQINFTRANEKEADRIGMTILSKSGYDPHSMPVFFERLYQNTRYYGGSQIPEYLRTHPLTTSRIADTRNHARQYAYKQISNSLDYDLVKIKLQLRQLEKLEEYIQASEKQGQQSDLNPQTKLMTEYGLGLAYFYKKQFKKSEKIFKNLLEQRPEQPFFLNALALNHREAGQTQQALALFQHIMRLYPDYYPSILYYTETLLKVAQFDQAYQQLLDYQQYGNLDPLGYKLLALASGHTKRISEGHQYMAEYYYLNGYTEQAIEQLKIAKKLPNSNFYNKSRIEARLKQLIAEQLEEKKQFKK